MLSTFYAVGSLGNNLMPLPVVMLSVAVYNGSWTLNVCLVFVVIVLEPCSRYIAHKASDFTCCCVSITARKPLRSRTSPRYLQGNMLIRATRVGQLRFERYLIISSTPWPRPIPDACKFRVIAAQTAGSTTLLWTLSSHFVNPSIRT